jgi:hypothetical protein
LASLLQVLLLILPLLHQGKGKGDQSLQTKLLLNINNNISFKVRRLKDGQGVSDDLV